MIDRDEFAKAALIGLLAQGRHTNGGSQTQMTPEAIANDAYKIADAMMKKSGRNH